MPTEKIVPHVAQNTGPWPDCDYKWYAVDCHGQTAGPFETKEDADLKLASLPAEHFAT